MALILNIETATRTCSVSLAENGVPLCTEEETSKRHAHAEKLTLFVQHALKHGGKAMKDLDAVAISKGPGSYTGLRIGVSVAKGLCYALDIPLIGINTLQALAVGAAPEWPDAVWFVPMIDARRMEVYTAVLDRKGEMDDPTKAVVLEEGMFHRWMDQGKTVLLGDGAAKFKPLMTHPNGVFDEVAHASGRHMASLSEQAYCDERFEDVAYFEPFYLKEFIPTRPKK